MAGVVDIGEQSIRALGGVASGFSVADFGEVAGAASATALPTVAASWVKLKAQYGNAGRVYVGKSDVTKAGGTTDATTGWELSAGEETPWIPLASGSLDELYRICDNAGDDLVYMALAA